MYEYRAFCIEVIDGDTIRVNLDLGFHLWQKLVLRLYGIKAPDLHGVTDPRPGQAAKDFLKQAIEGQSVIIRTYKDKEDTHGRVLADVFNGPAVSVNQRMLMAGLVTAYFGGKRN